MHGTRTPTKRIVELLNCVGITDKIYISMHIHNNFILSVPLYHLSFFAEMTTVNSIVYTYLYIVLYVTNSRCHPPFWPVSFANTRKNYNRFLFSVCQRSHFQIKCSNTYCILVKMNYFPSSGLVSLVGYAVKSTIMYKTSSVSRKKKHTHIVKSSIPPEEGSILMFDFISELFKVKKKKH